MKLKLSEITRELGVQSRRKLDQETIKNYAKLMGDGVVFRPIVVFGETNILADGWHRFEACKEAGIDEIDAERMEGDVRDATFYAISANNEHGLPMDITDRTANAKKLMLDVDWGKLGLRVIAQKVGLSKSTVGNIRGQLEAEGLLSKSDTRTVVKDGKEYEINVTTQQSPKPKAKPKEEKPKEQVSKVDTQPENSDLQEMSDIVMSLTEENQQLKDIIAIQAWDATDIEKEDIEETVKELRNQVKMLEMEVESLRSSRDVYMNQASELDRINKSLRNKLKKFEQ
jgi:ParB-like chromosome segregation protein Spo0J